MKRFFFVFIFILFSFFTTASAREFSFTDNLGNIIKVSTLGGDATISLTKKATSSIDATIKGVIAVFEFDKTKNSTVGDALFSDTYTFSGATQETKTFTMSGLVVDGSKTYSLVLQPLQGKKTTLEFTPDIYSLSFRPITQGSPSLKALYIAPKSDQRDLSLVLSSTVSPPINPLDVASWLQEMKIIPLGKIPASGSGEKDITLGANESGLWYYPALIATNSDGSYSLITSTGGITQFGTEQQIYSQWPLTYETNGSNATIRGKIDTTKHGNYALREFSIKLEYSSSGPFSATETITPSDTLFLNATKEQGGDYSWDLTSLTPNTKYYLRQTITAPKTPTSLGFVDVKVASFNSSRGYMPEGSSSAQNDFEKRSYRLLAPFPGLAVLLDPDLCLEMIKENKISPDNEICSAEDPSGFGGFLNYIFKLLIGLSAVLLVLRLVIEGFQYATTDVLALKISSKEKIWQSFFGLLLALSAYLLLNTINPRLVSNTINIDSLNIELEDYATIDPATYQKLTGQKIKPKPDYLILVDQLSQKNNIDACIVKAAITIESNWRPDIIGCDENARASDVPSRRAFIQSGITYDGTKFSERSVSANISNICPKKIDPKKPGYGLDWRFSKGGGLMQKTLFPKGYKTDAWYEGVKEGGTYWNNRTVPFPDFQNIITPEKNIQLGIDLLKNGLSECGNIEKAYRAYGSGSCNGSGQLLNSSVAKKMKEYQLCKSGAPGYKV